MSNCDLFQPGTTDHTCLPGRNLTDSFTGISRFYYGIRRFYKPGIQASTVPAKAGMVEASNKAVLV
jgi:hypothetical protein